MLNNSTPSVDRFSLLIVTAWRAKLRNNLPPGFPGWRDLIVQTAGRHKFCTTDDSKGLNSGRVCKRKQRPSYALVVASCLVYLYVFFVIIWKTQMCTITFTATCSYKSDHPYVNTPWNGKGWKTFIYHLNKCFLVFWSQRITRSGSEKREMTWQGCCLF